MPSVLSADADAHFDAAVASLRRFALPPTPQNYAIWYEFHAGRNDRLCRALTIALSNQRSIDGYMMAELHDLFFADTVERRAARDARATLREAAGRILEAGVDAERYGETLNEAAVSIDTDTIGLASTIARLAEETTMLATRSAEAATHAEVLRGALASRRISLRANAAPIGSVTVSVGAARYEPAEPVGDWIERADAALYRAKREGRNRVVVLAA